MARSPVAASFPTRVKNHERKIVFIIGFYVTVEIFELAGSRWNDCLQCFAKKGDDIRVGTGRRHARLRRPLGNVELNEPSATNTFNQFRMGDRRQGAGIVSIPGSERGFRD